MNLYLPFISDLLALCYHGISDSWPARTTVTPGDFEHQLERIVAHGYRGATFSDALTRPVSDPTLVVTFDDAHRSVLEHAVPVMNRLGLPGTVFAPTAYAGTDRLMGWDGYDVWLGTEHEEELRCMSWDELNGLAEDGWEIGSHTRTHPRLSQLGDDVRVRAQGQADLRVPEDVHHDPSGYTLLQQQRGRGVPCVVQPGVADLRRPQQGLPVQPVPPRVDGAAVGLAEDEASVLPRVGRGQSLLRLPCPMSAECVAESVG